MSFLERAARERIEEMAALLLEGTPTSLWELNMRLEAIPADQRDDTITAISRAVNLIARANGVSSSALTAHFDLIEVPRSLPDDRT